MSSFREPPRWLERALVLLLAPRDRQTIPGDLWEEYREEKLPTLGPARANYWYLRQVMSFAAIQIRKGGTVKQLLVLVSFFTAAAGVWLGVMENVLRHQGYAERSVMAACIALQSLGTLLVLLSSGGSALRKPVMAGAVAMALLGVSAIFKIARAEHFEGFVLVIGAALLVQGGLTLTTLLSARHDVQPG